MVELVDVLPQHSSLDSFQLCNYSIAFLETWNAAKDTIFFNCACANCYLVNESEDCWTPPIFYACYLLQFFCFFFF